MKKRLFSTLLVLCMVLALLPVTALAASTVASGDCGANGYDIPWVLDDNGLLTIEGNGPIVGRPWNDYVKQIRAVNLGSGITSIGTYMFVGSNLTEVTIPAKVTSIGYSTFFNCRSLTRIDVEKENKNYVSIDGVLFSADRTLIHTYPARKSGTSYYIPETVTQIEDSAFTYCTNLTSVTIPDSVINVGPYAFMFCSNLTEVIIPDSVVNIKKRAFYSCNSLTDVYYSGDEDQWEQINIDEENDDLLNATIHYNSEGTGQEVSTPSDSEYIYNITDPGENTYLDAERLKGVTNPTTAAEAVRDMTDGMTQAQKDSATGTDLATLYAETAVAKAASKPFTDSDILINAAAVTDLEAEAAQAVSAVDTALVSGGISTARYLSSTVTFTTGSTDEISIRIDPDILTTGVDKIRVEGPSYALTFSVSELEGDLLSPN